MVILGLSLSAGTVSSAFGETHSASVPGLRAQIRPVASQIPLGQPVWVRFLVENTTNEPITLIVPGTEPQIPSPEVGLPIQHVFSGGSSSSIVVTTESGRRWDQPVSYRPTAQAPILLLAPYATVGTVLDLREYFPSLRGAGQFRVTWQPYAGAVGTETATILIAPLKSVEIVTDEGTMTLRMFYDDAPGHVANFLELANTGFYTGKQFHRIAAGYMIQGGCPRGDGTGIRLDGKRISSEVNSRKHLKGSVSMALLDDNPNSGSCQFFLCNTDQPDWDSRYTVFGQLEGEESYATLDRLMASPIDEQGKPTRTLYMRSVRIIDAPHDGP